MIILGLDVAQKTGSALHDDSRPLSAIEAGVLKAVGRDYEDKSAALARALIILVREAKPDLVAIEMPIRTQPAGRRTVKMMGEDEVVEGGSGLNAVISSNQLVGAVAAVCGIKAIPFVTIAPASWRKAFLGFSRQPGWGRKEWKKAVREQCARERIVVTNDDMADAVGVAVAAKTTDTYRMLQYERQKRAA
ncbi:hypothetical protein [Aliihoeflea sp. 2WW]|uniref:hypothetical protein n=1 Tax=Aliihoeflea sp. 2WW TaxID=1381123 RepID=UPI000463D2BA|nr:hypothetical protein [Aliihoeflea sp. 2WW]